MTQQNTRTGIWLMIAAVACFSVQDGLSRHLAESYNVLMVVMVRYWVFAAFVIALALRKPQGFRAATRSLKLPIHFARAALLVTEVCVIVASYTLIGLINTHAVFAVCPLIVAALSGPILGERVGWQRWLAIGMGLCGVLIILQPGNGVFTLAALLPLVPAAMFALYSLLTRLATRDEPSFLSLYWSGIIGAVLMTFVGIWQWEPMSGPDWLWMAAYGGIAVFANWLLIRCYELAEASAVQPFAYMQIVFVSAVGIVIFGETLHLNVVLGASVVIGAGLYTLWQGRTATPALEPA